MLSQITVGIPWSSRKHFIDKTEFITSVDIYPYAKEHFYTPIKLFQSIKVLTMDISWHSLYKKLHLFVAPINVYPNAKKQIATEQTPAI